MKKKNQRILTLNNELNFFVIPSWLPRLKDFYFAVMVCNVSTKETLTKRGESRQTESDIRGDDSRPMNLSDWIFFLPPKKKKSLMADQMTRIGGKEKKEKSSRH